MENIQTIFIFIVGFAFIALASKQIGQSFAKINLPLISGFLFAGVIAGPYVLDLIPAEAIEKLRFIDEVSLAFIAFAAGSELYVKELKSRFKNIAWVTAGNAVVIPILGGLTLFLLADFIPFMKEMAVSGRIAVSMLAGAILVARSPSSAIAIGCAGLTHYPSTGTNRMTPLVFLSLMSIRRRFMWNYYSATTRVYFEQLRLP